MPGPNLAIPPVAWQVAGRWLRHLGAYARRAIDKDRGVMHAFVAAGAAP